MYREYKFPLRETSPLMENFILNIQETDDLAVFFVKGYFNDEAGEKIDDSAGVFLSKGKKILILDFSECVVINSLGVASLMGLAIRVTDEFQAKLIFSGLDPFKNQVLLVSGILPLVEVASNVQEGIEISKL